MSPELLLGFQETVGAIHSTRISGDLGLRRNGSVRSKRNIFGKISPPFEVDHFSRLDRFDRNGLLHLTITTHSQSEYLAVRYFPCAAVWRKTLLIYYNFYGLLTVDPSVLLVHPCARTSMCSFACEGDAVCSSFASEACRMFCSL